jgi:hypothetical protein
MSKKKFLAAVLLILGAAAPAMAQGVEVSATVGWTFSDGVDGDPRLAGNGNVYDRIDPKDGFNWGFGVGALVNENIELGFLFGQQMSKLLVDGTVETEVGDMSVNTYHGYFGYNFGFADAPARPYVFFGLGATNYGSVEFTRVGGVLDETQSVTKFSTTWGGGVKGYASPNVGFKAGIQWTPTYIKTDSEGWWCDPYWGGCYVVGDPQYANQWTLNGGVLFRF